jgi:hypothetical protein
MQVACDVSFFEGNEGSTSSRTLQTFLHPLSNLQGNQGTCHPAPMNIQKKKPSSPDYSRLESILHR